jgi:glycosyltransferase involved in cell wall biosynthesis
MRILQLINTLEYGGAEQILSTLAIELSRRGHDVHVACLRDPGVMPVPKSSLDAAGVKLVAFYKGDGFDFATLRRLSAYVRANGIEVVHSHNPLAAHYGAAAARWVKAAAAVNTLHGTATLSMPAWAKALYYASGLASDRVVSVCRHVQDTLRGHFPLPARKCAVIYNGIPVDSLLKLAPRRNDGGVTVFGTMARLIPVKDHRSLLTAFAALHRRYPNTRLRILGDGELRPALERQAVELGLEGSVAFLGWSPDVANFLAQTDIFVLSSLSEGLPLTVLEAMAAGRPLVATAVGGVPEAVEDARCGWLCPAGDAVALADAMERALGAPDRVQRGANGRNRVIEQHSLAAMTDHYENLFGELLRAKGRPAFDLKRQNANGARFGSSC